MTTDIDVHDLLSSLHDHAADAITTTAEIIDVDQFPSLDDMYSEVPKWLRIDDVVAVVADLKSSTKLNFGKHANTSARLYEAVTGSLVRVADTFGAAFIDIQGDGLFALYHGERRYERAMCAAITMTTLSEQTLVPLVEKHFSDRFPGTGIKVGLDASRLLVKEIGIRGTNEPVWAGRAVNWATKAAQTADAHQLVVTRRVFQKFEANEYVRYSCGCPDGVVSDLWLATDVESLTDEERGECKMLPCHWCPTHGAEFCRAVLDGQRDRGMGLAA